MLRVGLTSFTLTQTGKTIALPPAGVIVVVGPNNSGKSTLLKELHEAARSIQYPARPRKWVATAASRADGTETELKEWFLRYARPIQPDVTYGGELSLRPSDYANHRDHWSWDTIHSAFSVGAPVDFAARFSDWTMRYIGASERLGFDNETQPRDSRVAPEHPLHFLADDPGLEARFASKVREAFRFEVSINRHDPRGLKLRRGAVPHFDGRMPAPASFLDDFDAMPDLADEGDGVRSFASMLLALMTGERFVTFIDEPEAFLHPPQAQLLGRLLVEEGQPNGQVIVATHSRDVLQGVLDSSFTRQRDVAILRLDVLDDDTRVLRELPAQTLRELWSDPLMNYSRIVDGLFHRGAVVTENDSDSKFFEAHVDAQSAGAVRHDLIFTNVGGKTGFVRALGLLRSLGIRAMAVGDIDVLDDPDFLRRVCNAAGQGLSEDDSHRAERVNGWVTGENSAATVAHLRAAAGAALTRDDSSPLSDEERRAIAAVTRARRGWASVKRGGVNSLDRSVYRDAQTLLNALEARGILLVPQGEMESLYPGVPTAKARPFVNAVLEQGLHLQADTAAADFARRILRWFEQEPPTQ